MDQQCKVLTDHPGSVPSPGQVWEAQRSLCSQMRTRETRNVKHTELSLQRERCITCFLTRRPRMNVINCLVIFALCGQDLPLDCSHELVNI